MSTEKVYQVNEKVFAKMRGYSPWPAKITGVISDTPLQLRYDVFFYGTREHARCKPEHLFSYEENKYRLGKPKKFKKFNEALSQIERDNGDFPQYDSHVFLLQKNTSNVKPEASTNECENINKIEKSKEPCKSNARKRKIIDIKPEASSNSLLSKKSKSSGSSKSEGVQPMTLKRTCKNTKNTKKNVDVDETNFKDLKTNDDKAGIPKPTISRNVACSASTSAQDCNVIEMDSSSEQNGQTKDKSSNPKMHKSKSHELVLNSNDSAKLQIHGRYIIKECSVLLKDVFNYTSADTLEIFETEQKMLNFILKLNSALKYEQPNYDTAIESLGHFLKFKINALMLIKNEEVVEIITMASSFVPSAGGEKASKIRDLANRILNKFSSLFTIPVGQSFNNIFDNEVKNFYKITKNLSVDQRRRLTEISFK